MTRCDKKTVRMVLETLEISVADWDATPKTVQTKLLEVLVSMGEVVHISNQAMTILERSRGYKYSGGPYVGGD